ncbi:MAG: hypothetical protein V3T53_05285 [Phycisphaerales bacterium]
MHNSQQHREQDGWQQVMTSTVRDNAQKLAPEVRAARTLLAPDVQQQIAQLAEGIEATLLGNQPAQLTRKRRWRRGISLWIGIPLAGLVSVVIVSSAGWAGAVRYYDIAEENRLIAEQQGELAATERELRKELEARDEQLRQIATAQLEAVAGILETGRYDRALALLDLFADLTANLADRDAELATRLRQQRIDTIVSLISDAYGSDVDLSGVRTELLRLTDSEVVGRDAPDSTNRD